MLFFFKQKTAYEIGTGDWSSDVCSSDLRNLKLHHIDNDPNMSLEKISDKIEDQKFLVKNSDFHKARTCRECQNPKNLIMGFLSNRQPEESETSPHR